MYICAGMPYNAYMALYLYIDVDAFLASVEQAINPRLDGRPVMVGGLAQERGIVYCPSYEARARGVRLGTNLAEAARRIPEGVFLKGEANTYEEYSRQLLAILGDYSPRIEKISQDEACLEISGLERYFGTPQELALALKQQIREQLHLSTSVGIGSSRVIAKIASELVKPDNLTIVPAGEEREFLGQLPVEKIPGIGPVNQRVLNEMGIRTIGQLQAIPEEYLATLFGRNGRKFAAYAIGSDGPLIRDFRAVRSVNRETGLAADVTDTGLLLGHYYYLLERACRRLRHLQKKAGGVMMKFRYGDFIYREGYAPLGSPSWDERVMYDRVRTMFLALHQRRVGIRFVGVTLMQLKNALHDESFILDRAEKNQRLLGSLDDIRNRFGFLAVTTGRTATLAEHYRKTATGYELRTPGLSL